MGLTATATATVLEDIKTTLDIKCNFVSEILLNFYF